MNAVKTFVKRNERRITITSYFLNTQTTVKIRDVARLGRKQAIH